MTVDLAEVRDFAAIARLHVSPDEEEPWRAAVELSLPEETVDASPVAQLRGWATAGHFVATPGPVTDYRRIEDRIVEWTKRYTVAKVGFDRALFARMSQALQERLDEDLLVEVPQTVVVVDPAMKELERRILSRGIVLPRNPVLRWMFGNVVVQRNHKGEVYPRKRGGKDSWNKIDGVTALLMATTLVLGGALDEMQGSIYDQYASGTQEGTLVL